jgi:hypothetical protein
LAVPKQGKLPSLVWMALMTSSLRNLPTCTPRLFAFSFISVMFIVTALRRIFYAKLHKLIVLEFLIGHHPGYLTSAEIKFSPFIFNAMIKGYSLSN